MWFHRALWDFAVFEFGLCGARGIFPRLSFRVLRSLIGMLLTRCAAAAWKDTHLMTLRLDRVALGEDPILI